MRGKPFLYVPGMISLLLLALLGYFFLKPYQRHERAIEIMMPADYVPTKKGESKLQFDTSCLSLPGNQRTYTDLLFTGERGYDARQMGAFERKTDSILVSGDTIRGLHLTFGEKAFYGSFIQALDICRKNVFIDFVVFENQIWCFYANENEKYRKKRLERRKLKLQNEDCRREIQIVKSNQKPIRAQYGRITDIWPALLIMLVLAFLSLRKTGGRLL